jgi:hypothetical protein
LEEVAGHDIGQDQEDPADQHGHGHEHTVVRSQDQAGQVGDHEADEPDHSRDGDAGGGDHGGDGQ